MAQVELCVMDGPAGDIDNTLLWCECTKVLTMITVNEYFLHPFGFLGATKIPLSSWNSTTYLIQTQSRPEPT